MKKIMWLLVLVIIIYSALDIYQTKLLFDIGYYEANPFLNWLIKLTESWAIIIPVKFGFIGLLIFGLWKNNKQKL